MNWGGMRRRDRGTDSTGGTGQAESAASEQTGAEAVEPESAGAEMAEAAPEIMGSDDSADEEASTEEQAADIRPCRCVLNGLFTY